MLFCKVMLSGILESKLLKNCVGASRSPQFSHLYQHTPDFLAARMQQRPGMGLCLSPGSVLKGQHGREKGTEADKKY